MIWTIIIILVVLMLLGHPGTGWHSYGYGPSGLLLVLLVVLLILALLGRL